MRGRASKGRQHVCIREGMGVVSYYALAAGFLSGKYRSEQDFGTSARGGGSEYLNDRGLAILSALEKVAFRRDALLWGGARLAADPPRPHRPDRQRHQS